MRRYLLSMFVIACFLGLGGSIALAEDGYVFVDVWGGPGVGSGDGEFASPRDIAFDSDGNVYVTDNDNNRVQKFTSSGQFITKWNCDNPMGIAVDEEGYVYVADVTGDKIWKFEQDGGSYTPVTGWQIDVIDPIGIALDVSGNIYVCEEGTSLVKKFSDDTSYITSLDGQFNTPVYLQVDSTGKVYVADLYGNSIKKFSSTDGINYTYEVLCSPNNPGGVAVDLSGYVYVTGYNDNWVKKFSPDGHLVTSWGESGLDNGQFTNPIGVEVKSLGYVYVADHGAHRIQKFAPVPETVFIPGGEFEMGDHFGDGAADELPVHEVYVDSFHMGKFEITNREYCDYLNSAYAASDIKVDSGIVYAADDAGNTEPYCDTSGSHADSQIAFSGGIFSVRIKGGRNMSTDPMVQVSWYGAVAYSNWLSGLDGSEPCYDLSTWTCDFAKNGYRLPTEAEWEYAARGGEHNPYYQYPWGDSIDDSKANYWESGDPYETGDTPWTTPVGYYDGSQIPAGSDMANGYGLYDMTGNAWEWCNDWYDPDYYDISPYENPRGPASGVDRVLRGGGLGNDAYGCRLANRDNGHGPDARNNDDGFRIVRATVYHVDCNGSDANSGRSRANAFATIQAGIDAAFDGDTVLVWPCVYEEECDFLGKAITVRSAADAAVVYSPTDYAFRFHNAEGPDSRLENLVLAGGMFGVEVNVACSPTLKNLTVADNEFGIACYENGEPNIINCIFANNLYGDLLDCTAKHSWVQQDIGPVAYWHLDEPDGLTAYDAIGTNHGTLINGPTWTTGMVNGALDFDGVDDYVDTIPQASIPSVISVSMWVYPTVESGQLWGSIGNASGGKDGFFTHYYADGEYVKFKYYKDNSDRGLWLSTNGSVLFNTWSFLTFTVDNSNNVKIYVNSVEAASGNFSVPCTSHDTDLMIGKSIWSQDIAFNGKIDEVAIYDRALSGEEVARLYQDSAAGFGYHDPMFVDPNNGDYHLLSERGRHRSTTDEWLLDDVTSPCVDGGDPMESGGDERTPNGGRVNMGAYGGTAYGSMSEWPLVGDNNRDGRVDIADFAAQASEWLMALPWAQ